MNAHHDKQVAGNGGFSTVELLVAVAIGLLLMSGILGLFVTNKSVFLNTTHATELQENGRFALDYLLQDLRHAYFFGEKHYDGIELDGAPEDQDIVEDEDHPKCTEIDKAYSFNSKSSPPSFPLHGSATNFGKAIGCIKDASSVYGIPSDVLVIKSVRPHPVYTTDDLIAGRVYIASNRLEGYMRLFPSDTEMPSVSPSCSGSKCLPYGAYWPYQFSAYYIRAGNTPTLARKVLERNAEGEMMIVSQDLADGVEGMRFLYGVSADGTPPTYVSANTVSNWNDVVSVQVHLLLRTTQPDRSYRDALSYQMGDVTVTANQSTAVSQGAELRNFHRSVISSTVMLRNKPLMDN